MNCISYKSLRTWTVEILIAALTFSLKELSFYCHPLCLYAHVPIATRCRIIVTTFTQGEKNEGWVVKVSFTDHHEHEVWRWPLLFSP